VPGAKALVTVALAAVAAGAAWASLGTVAVTQDDTRARVFALPPSWLLLAFVIATLAAAWYAKPRPGRLWPLLIAAVLFLPYLPGPIPTAFLIWDGPIEGFVWAAVLAGLLFDRPPSIALLSEPRRAPWIAGAIAKRAITPAKSAGIVAFTPRRASCSQRNQMPSSAMPTTTPAQPKLK